MAETWDREFFDIRDTEQRDGLVSVIEADANGVRDVGQTSERPQTVGEYMASLPVVQPEVTAKEPAGGGDPLDPEWQERVITYGLAAWDTPQAEQEAQAEITDTSLVDAAPEPVAEFDAVAVEDALRRNQAGLHHIQLRQEQQRRQAARVNIRQLSKVDPRAAAEAASAERIERHGRQEWDDTLPFPEPPGMTAEAEGAELPGEEPKAAPDAKQQRELGRVAATTNTPSELGSRDPWNMQMPFGGGGDEVTAILRDMLTELKNLASKLDLDSRWGV